MSALASSPSISTAGVARRPFENAARRTAFNARRAFSTGKGQSGPVAWYGGRTRIVGVSRRPGPAIHETMAPTFRRLADTRPKAGHERVKISAAWYKTQGGRW